MNRLLLVRETGSDVPGGQVNDQIGWWRHG